MTESDPPTVPRRGQQQVAPSGPCLVQIYGAALGKCHPIGPELTVGRDESNAVVIDEADVSRRHARFRRRADGGCSVEDLGSTNGTFVNDREIGEETSLASGDLVKLGHTIFKFLEGGNVETLYHEEIYRMAITDGLTKLPNKRYLEEFLEREIARSDRHRRPLALAMLDLDRFKEINDTHGHLAGDRVLAEISSVVARETRREDLFARYAGDEFALVLTETDLASALAHCERLARQVRKCEVELDGTRVRTTASIGVVSVASFVEPERLVEIADAALYRAKSAGGNRVASGTAAAAGGAAPRLDDKDTTEA